MDEQSFALYASWIFRARRSRTAVGYVLLVPGGGIEPPQGFWPLRILSPLRLPISPSRLAIYERSRSAQSFASSITQAQDRPKSACPTQARRAAQDFHSGRRKCPGYCCMVCAALGWTCSFCIWDASHPPPRAFTRYTEATSC